ncbi:unnamed protein product, partial [Closterium sp. NIES-53]
MASLNVLTFDHEGRLIQFDTWLNDLQLYILSDSRDNVSLFDHTSGASLAPPATTDSTTCSQWLTHDAAARLAVRNHLPSAECAHFEQHKNAKALYDAVVARYSSPATTLGRLILPYLFPELSAFATVEDLITHLCTSDAPYRAALPAEFLVRNHPPPTPMDQFLALDPTELLLAAKTSVVAVGAARGTPRTPFFERCSPSPLAPSYASAAAVNIFGAQDVGVASALSRKLRSSKGKGRKSGGGGSGGGGGGDIGGVEVAMVVAAVGVVAGVGASVVAVAAAVGVAVVAAVGVVVVGVKRFRGEVMAVARDSSSVSGLLSVGRLGVVFDAQFGDEAKRSRWAELRSGVDVFALDYDAILAAMYALSFSVEGDCYRCVPPDPGIEAAALGASESPLPGTTPVEALHTFTMDLGAFSYFFCDSTTLTPLSAPVPVRLADPSGGLVLARSSTVLPCPAVPSGSLSGLHLPSFSTKSVRTTALQDAMVTTTTLGGQRVSICMCTRTGRHLATFTRRPGSSLYTLATKPPQVAASAQVSASGPVAAPCSCRLLSHKTLLWHHRLGHPSLPRLCDMHSRLLVSGLPRSLPPLPSSPALPCLPCIEGWQRAATPP